MQKYKSHKVVVAAKIESIVRYGDSHDRYILHCEGDSVVVWSPYMTKHQAKVGGYYVRYPDGYESYSPAEAFEGGYAAVDAAPGPKAIVINNNQSGDTFIGQTPPHTTLSVGTELYTAPPAPAEQACDPAITSLRDARGACEMTGPPLSEEVPVGSQAGIAAITRGLSRARDERIDLDRSMHVLAAQIRALRADAKRMVDLEELLREAIPGLKNYGQGSDTYDLICRIKAILP